MSIIQNLIKKELMKQSGYAGTQPSISIAETPAPPQEPQLPRTNISGKAVKSESKPYLDVPGVLKRFFQEQPAPDIQDIGKGVMTVGKFIKGAQEETTRSGASVGLSYLATASKLSPIKGEGIHELDISGPEIENVIARAIFGNKPLKSIEKRIQESDLTTKKFAQELQEGKIDLPFIQDEKEFGAGIQKHSLLLSTIGIVALGSLDFTGGGGKKQTIELIAKAKDVGFIAKTLRQIGVSEDLVLPMAEKFSKISNKKTISTALNNYKELENASKLAKGVMDPSSSEGVGMVDEFIPNKPQIDNEEKLLQKIVEFPEDNAFINNENLLRPEFDFDGYAITGLRDRTTNRIVNWLPDRTINPTIPPSVRLRFNDFIKKYNDELSSVKPISVTRIGDKLVGDVGSSSLPGAMIDNMAQKYGVKIAPKETANAFISKEGVDIPTQLKYKSPHADAFKFLNTTEKNKVYDEFIKEGGQHTKKAFFKDFSNDIFDASTGKIIEIGGDAVPTKSLRHAKLHQKSSLVDTGLPSKQREVLGVRSGVAGRIQRELKTSQTQRIHPGTETGRLESDSLETVYNKLGKDADVIKMADEKLSPTGLKFKEVDLSQVLRGTKGMTAEDIMKTYPDIQLKRDVPATDIHGNKVKIPDGEVLTPYEMKGNKVLLQDGETYVVSKSQFQNIKSNAISKEASEFAPELKGTEETVRGSKPTSLKAFVEDSIGAGKFEKLNAEQKANWEFQYKKEKGVMADTKYSSYQLPDGKNYKEILIKAPEKVGGKPVSRAEFEMAMREDGTAGDYSDYLKQFKKGEALGEGNFKSSHWDEPNVISHIRMNERTYQGKKVSFLEELQSDWAREQRQPGFKDSKYAPTHPLLKNWQELSIKRALKDAVDSDAEYFAWINGEQTSARYNLATKIERVAWEDSTSRAGSKSVSILPVGKGQRSLGIFVAKDGKITLGDMSTAPSNWDGKKLDEVLGKGLADKIMEKESGTLSGEGLKFGGEWANNLYDKQVGNIVSDLTGAKIEKLDMGLPIEKAKETLRIGTDAFKPLTKENINVDQIFNLGIRDSEHIITNVLKDGTFEAVSIKSNASKIVKNIFQNSEEARKFYFKKGRKVDAYGDTTDEVIEYIPTTEKRGWEVSVKEVGTDEIRTHSTQPDVEKIALAIAQDGKIKNISELPKRTFDIFIKKTTQQGIKLTDEIKSKIRGEAPDFQASGKQFEDTPTKVEEIKEVEIPTLTKTDAPIAKQDFSGIIKDIKERGGITVSFDGNIINKGFAFSVLNKVDETRIPLNKLSNKSFTKTFNALKEKYGNTKGLHFGGWVEDNVLVVDVSAVSDDVTKSIYDGIIKKQDAIGDLAKYAKGEDGTIFISEEIIDSLRPISRRSLESSQSPFRNWEEVTSYYRSKAFKNSDDVNNFVIDFLSAKDKKIIEPPSQKPPIDQELDPENFELYEKFNETISKKWTKIREVMEDDWIRVKKLIGREDIKISDVSNMYDKRKLLAGRVHTRFEELDKISKTIDREIIDSSRKFNIDDETFAKSVNDYLHAKHAPERNAKLGDGAAGMKTDEANKIIQNIESSKEGKEVKKIANTILALNRKTLDILLEGGVITEDLHGLLRQTYKNHVPLQRIMDEADNLPDILSGKGLDVKGTGLFKAKGSERQVRDIWSNVVANYKQALVRAEKNIVDNATLKFARDNEHLDLFEIIKPKAIGRTFGKEGEEGKLIFQKINDPTILHLFENGKPIYIKIKDPQLAVALKGVNRKQLDGFFRFVGSITRFYSGLATRFNPEFALPNKFRDIQEVMVYLAAQKETGFKGSTKVLTQEPGSFKSILEHLTGKDTEGARLYQQMRMDGGTTGGLGLSTRQQIDVDLKQIKKLNRSNPRKAVQFLFERVDDWNTLFEDSTRLSVYKTALSQGVSRQKAAVLAKQASIDFNKFGTGGPIINSLYMFSNASIQGSAKMLMSMKNPKVAGAVIGAAGTAVFATSQWNDNLDPKWRDKVSKWDRLNSLTLVLPSSNGDFNYVSIPVSWGIKPIKVSMDFAYDLMTQKDTSITEGFEGILVSMLEAYNPVGGTDTLSAVLPTVFDLPTELGRNKAWSGSKIRPDWDKYAPSSTQYFGDLKDSVMGRVFIKSTETLSSMSGHRIEISPADLDYAFNQIVGGAGRSAFKTVNTINAIGNKEVPVSTREVPFVSRFLRSIPEDRIGAGSSQAEYIRGMLTEQSRDRFNFNQMAESTYQEMKKMSQDDVNKIWNELKKENPELLKKVKEVYNDETLGLTYTDRLVKQLGVTDWQRSQYIYSELKKFKTKEERSKLWTDLATKKIITETVAKQIRYLAEHEK